MKLTANSTVHSLFTIVALFATPLAARAGTVLTGTTSANGGFAVLVGGFNNTVDGFASGIITGASNAITAGNSMVGCGNRNQVLLPSDSAAIVSGNDNVVTGVHGVIAGGTFNTSGGFASFIHGNHLNDGGNAGSVMLSDSDPFGLRLATPLVNSTADSFTGSFNGGYFLRTDQGQGTNPNNGLFVRPGAFPNVLGASSTARLGVNILSAIEAIDIATDTNNLRAMVQMKGDGGNVWRMGVDSDDDFRVTDVTGSLTFINLCDGGSGPFVGLSGRIGASHPVHVGVGVTNGNGAHCTAGGAWTNGSSREFKENFKAVDTRAVLRKVAELPVQSWNYKKAGDELHIGPVAEDFREAFGLGHDKQYICTVDADGVALAAIQGLHDVVEEKDARIAELEKDQAALEARLTVLEKLILD